jgi:hypothetical protein
MLRWHGENGATPPATMPPVVPAAAAKLSSPPCVTEWAMLGTGGTGQKLSMDNYLVGEVTMFDAQTGLSPAGELKNLCFLAG